ncbi:efflux RND transporter periplasmic adaptor subunit [Spiribacter sp. 2438]|nr:efflux RND transporter periplasmic adaptor subunit [Spiribacter sp. 2438]
MSAPPSARGTGERCIIKAMKTRRYSLLLAAVCWLAFSPVNAQMEAPVVVTPVESARHAQTIQAVGQSRALRSVELQAESSGIVTEVLIEADRRVEAGDVLLRLDDRSEQVAVGLAGTRLADARQLLARYRRADGTGAFSEITLDEARREVELAELELRDAEIRLDDRTLRAPFAGFTGLSDIEPGQRITEDTVVTTLDNREQLRIRFSVAERHYGGLQIGEEITVAAWAQPGSQPSARLTRIDSRVSASDGTVRAEALLDNAEDRFRPGMRFRVSLDLPGDSHWRIPETALLWGDDGAYAWRIRDDQAERVRLDLISRNGAHVLVDGPLDEGDDIVSEGVQRMRPGRAVRVIDSATLDNYPALEAMRDTQADG